MKISDALAQLTAIQARFGDLDIIGGSMTDDTPLGWIGVLNQEGMEIFPNDPNGVGENNVAGVFIHG